MLQSGSQLGQICRKAWAGGEGSGVCSKTIKGSLATLALLLGALRSRGSSEEWGDCIS